MFPAESTSMQCINITIIDDSVFEGDETFTLTIEVTTPDVTEGNTTTTVTITEGIVFGKFIRLVHVLQSPSLS